MAGCVAKDAADVLLLEKDLDVLADGVIGGRRIFANTMKYVLMGTSSNFGNMFSAAGASVFLTFLPMLPSQILRRFMLFFGPISSAFDFLTFGVMLWVFHAGPALFRSGWFVESLATQTLVIFAIRTRRIPFFRSRPSLPLTLAALAVVTVGTVLPFTPLAHPLGFQPLPGPFFLFPVGAIIAYLALAIFGKNVEDAYGPARRKMRRCRASAPAAPSPPCWAPTSSCTPAPGLLITRLLVRAGQATPQARYAGSPL